MRNIAEILEDDRNGKSLSQTERQIAVAYVQGKYDAVRELKIGNNNAMEVLNKVRDEILGISSYKGFELGGVKDGYRIAMVNVLNIIDKYKAEVRTKDE